MHEGLFYSRKRVRHVAWLGPETASQTEKEEAGHSSSRSRGGEPPVREETVHRTASWQPTAGTRVTVCLCVSLCFQRLGKTPGEGLVPRGSREVGRSGVAGKRWTEERRLGL
eukprot:COSAG03_NODE_1707_length_3621_cov_33.777399_3_plen_112_part_00